MTLPATIIEQAIEALEDIHLEINECPRHHPAAGKISIAKESLQTLLTTLPGEGIEALPEGWFLMSIIVRRDKAFLYGGDFTYDALLEGGDNMQATGHGSTPSLAIRAALEKIGESDE